MDLTTGSSQSTGMSSARLRSRVANSTILSKLAIVLKDAGQSVELEVSLMSARRLRSHVNTRRALLFTTHMKTAVKVRQTLFREVTVLHHFEHPSESCVFVSSCDNSRSLSRSLDNAVVFM